MIQNKHSKIYRGSHQYKTTLATIIQDDEWKFIRENGASKFIRENGASYFL